MTTKSRFNNNQLNNCFGKTPASELTFKYSFYLNLLQLVRILQKYFMLQKLNIFIFQKLSKYSAFKGPYILTEAKSPSG